MLAEAALSCRTDRRSLAAVAPVLPIAELSAGIIGAVIATVADVLRPHEPAVPEAIAHVKSRPVKAVALAEPPPDPEPPAAGDAPRFLK